MDLAACKLHGLNGMQAERFDMFLTQRLTTNAAHLPSQRATRHAAAAADNARAQSGKLPATLSTLLKHPGTQNADSVVASSGVTAFCRASGVPALLQRIGRRFGFEWQSGNGMGQISTELNPVTPHHITSHHIMSRPLRKHTNATPCLC